MAYFSSNQDVVLCSVAYFCVPLCTVPCTTSCVLYPAIPLSTIPCNTSVFCTLQYLCEHYIPVFRSFSKKRKLETILYGHDVDNNDIFTTNVSLQLATQKYILHTKCFI